MSLIAGLLEIQTDRRLLRLFAVGCCRQIWDEITDERSRTAVGVAERFADSQATKEELKIAQAAAWFASNNNAIRAAAWTTVHYLAWNSAYDVADYAAYYAAFAVTRERQLELYHCVFTKIYFTTTSQNARNLAKIIYEECNWPLMSILGDALEEDGCPAEVVSHCKETEHARGCWVVDNILKKR